MSEVIRQTLHLFGRLLCPPIYFGDLGEQHVVCRLARLSWHVDRPGQSPIGHRVKRAESDVSVIVLLAIMAAGTTSLQRF